MAIHYHSVVSIVIDHRQDGRNDGHLNRLSPFRLIHYDWAEWAVFQSCSAHQHSIWDLVQLLDCFESICRFGREAWCSQESSENLSRLIKETLSRNLQET